VYISWCRLNTCFMVKQPEITPDKPVPNWRQYYSYPGGWPGSCIVTRNVSLTWKGGKSRINKPHTVGINEQLPPSRKMKEHDQLAYVYSRLEAVTRTSCRCYCLTVAAASWKVATHSFSRQFCQVCVDVETGSVEATQEPLGLDGCGKFRVAWVYVNTTCM